jgi:hypothetical protein
MKIMSGGKPGLQSRDIERRYVPTDAAQHHHRLCFSLIGS